MKKYENFIAQKSHTIACVSFKDARRFQRLFKKVNAVEIPISFDFDRLNSFKQNSAEPSIIWGFIGKFDWPPNHDGLLWFLTYVWSRVQKQSHHRLVIAGSGTLSKELEKAIRDAQIQYLGFVNDINEFYSQIDAVIIPIFYGGGTRVKAIEAAQFGKIIVSTRLGVEGLSLIQDTDYLRAETLNQWTQIISETKIDKTLREKARNAHLKTSQKFSNKAVKKAWLNCLN